MGISSRCGFYFQTKIRSTVTLTRRFVQVFVILAVAVALAKSEEAKKEAKVVEKRSQDKDLSTAATGRCK